MNKLTLIALLAFYSSVVYSQHDFLVFKKKDRTISNFSTGSNIAFVDKDRQWIIGTITKVKNDSFSVRLLVVRYYKTPIDTIHFGTFPFALSDVYALPKKGVHVRYVGVPYRISSAGGHVHWYWIKSGYIFRVAGAGYVLLNVVNGLTDKKVSFSAGKLATGAGVFLFGKLLHRIYKPILRLGKKYHLEEVKISN